MTEAKAEGKKEAKDSLLVLSKFLRAAAAKRQDVDATNEEENKAFEGALLLVYGGDANAVIAMEKLIEGSDEKVPTVHGDALEITCKATAYPSGVCYWYVANIHTTDKQIRDLSAEYAPSAYAAEEAWVEEVAQSEAVPPTTQEATPPIESDPTIVHAGLTEIDAEAEPATNGVSSHVETPTVPDASSIDAGAANAAGEANWEPKMSASSVSGPEGWVEVPRDPTETDTGVTATPAAVTSTQSWAEDVPTEPAAAPTSTDPPTTNANDGFHEVHHSRGRGRGGFQGEGRGGNRGRGGYRGDRGGEGGYRGRGGHRGDRGGDGGYRGRGGRGGPRGQRGRGEPSS